MREPLTANALASMRDAGLSLTEIARLTGRSRAGICWANRKYGLVRTPVDTSEEMVAVGRLVAEGKTVREIAEILGLSLGAAHRRRTALGIKGRTAKPPRVQLVERREKVADVVPRSGPSARALEFSDPFGLRNLGVSGESGHVSTLPV